MPSSRPRAGCRSPAVRTTHGDARAIRQRNHPHGAKPHEARVRRHRERKSPRAAQGPEATGRRSRRGRRRAGGRAAPPAQSGHHDPHETHDDRGRNKHGGREDGCAGQSGRRSLSRTLGPARGGVRRLNEPEAPPAHRDQEPERSAASGAPATRGVRERAESGNESTMNGRRWPSCSSSARSSTFPTPAARTRRACTHGCGG